MSSKRDRRERRRKQNRERQEQKAKPNSQVGDFQPPTPPVNTVDGPNQTGDGGNVGNGSNRHDGQHQKPRWPSRRCLVIAEIIFSGLIALFTGLQVYYGNKQWEATDKQFTAMLAANEITKKQLELAQLASEQTAQSLELASLDQRPWVSFDEFEIRDLEEGKQPIVVLSISNTGKLPGTIDTIYFEAMLLDWENPNATMGDIVSESSGILLEELRASSIPPGRTFRLNVRQLPVLTKESLADVRDMKQAICITGVIHYTHPNGNEFATRAIGYYESTTDRFLMDYNLMNDVDDEGAQK